MNGLISATAMSLYQYNVNAGERSAKLFEHFQGDCGTIEDLVTWCESKHWATEMPWPTAVVYLTHAMARYGTLWRTGNRTLHAEYSAGVKN